MASKIDVIYDTVPFLTMADKVSLAKIINNYDKTLIIQCSDGVRVHMNKMPAELVNQIYVWLMEKNN